MLLRGALYTGFIYIIVGLIWRWYEYAFEKEIDPNLFDSVLCLVLSVSIALNILTYEAVQKSKKRGYT